MEFQVNSPSTLHHPEKKELEIARAAVVLESLPMDCIQFQAA